MKKLLVALVLCLIPALAGASTVVLTWNPNTETMGVSKGNILVIFTDII
jgi:hypothetical protein